jgi:hypothetical protein
MTTMRQTIRHTIAAHHGSAPVVAGAAFAVGLVLGICIFLIPFAMSKGGKPAEVKQVATASTSGVATPALPAPVAQSKTDNSTSAVAAANETTAAAQDDTAAACDRQAWPYVTQECRQKSAARDRNVRVVTTDANAPSVIVSPAPTIPAAAPAKPSAQQATQSPPTASSAAVAAAPPAWAQTLHKQITPVATQAQVSSTQTPAISAAQNAMDVQPKATEAQSKPAEAQPKTANERRTRAADDSQSGKTMVRTIEFADGRKVTITRPIGKGGAAAAAAELDRASQRELARERAEDDEPSREPAMAQADDDDLDAAPRTSRRRVR